MFIVDVGAREFMQLDDNDCTGFLVSARSYYDLSWSPDGRFLAYYPVSKDAAHREIRFYDALQRTTLSIDQIARLTNSWLPDWSPDWKNEVYVDDPVGDLYGKCPSQPQSLPAFRYKAVVLRIRGTKALTVAACVQWEEIDFFKWTDPNHLLFVGREPRDGGTKEEEWFLLDRISGNTVNLGADVDGRFFDDSKRLARIKVTAKPESFEPSQCALSILDLATLKETEIEPTYCIQPAELKLLESQRQLVYLNSAIPLVSVDAADNIPRVHVVNLDSLTVKELPVTNVQDIGSTSPDNHLLLLVQDTSHMYHTIYHTEPYGSPSVLIYDVQREKILYSHVWAGSFFGERYFGWSPDSSAFAFTVTSDYMVTLSNPPVSIRLNDSSLSCENGPDSICLSRLPAWSPNGQFLLFFSDEGIKVMRRKDNQIIPITRLVDAKDYYVTADWQSDGLLLVETVPRSGSDPLYTLKRWLVNPGLATRN